MNDDLKRVNLRDIVDRISENTIVLPDFQRGFTWKENNRQKALLASVLTKLPIGTVLFLNVKTEDYGYKKIGKNERNIDNLEGKQEVKALLDGQQYTMHLLRPEGQTCEIPVHIRYPYILKSALYSDDNALHSDCFFVSHSNNSHSCNNL